MLPHTQNLANVSAFLHHGKSTIAIATVVKSVQSSRSSHWTSTCVYNNMESVACDSYYLFWTS